MSMSPDSRIILGVVAVAVFAAASLGSLGSAADRLPHRDDFTAYARVDRPDDTHRIMLVDNGSLAAMRRGQATESVTILMESFSGTGLRSVFVKRREADGWAYGAVRPGEGLDGFRPGPQCSACHRVVSDRDGMFTGAMLERFVESDALQRKFCGRPGRSPCDASVYAGG